MPKITKLLVTEAAPQLGVSINTLLTGLERMRVKTSRGRKYPLKQLFTACFGDLEAERIRETRARADLLELERREKEKELVPMHLAVSLMRNGIGPVRTKVLELPNQMSGNVNPSDPEHARVQLTDWVDRFLASMTDEMDAVSKHEHKTLADTVGKANDVQAETAGNGH